MPEKPEHGKSGYTDKQKIAAFDRIHALCLENLEFAREHHRDMKDGDHYIYETAMQATLGDDIFDELNELTRHG